MPDLLPDVCCCCGPVLQFPALPKLILSPDAAAQVGWPGRSPVLQLAAESAAASSALAPSLLPLLLLQGRNEDVALLAKVRINANEDSRRSVLNSTHCCLLVPSLLPPLLLRGRDEGAPGFQASSPTTFPMSSEQ